MSTDGSAATTENALFLSQSSESPSEQVPRGTGAISRVSTKFSLWLSGLHLPPPLPYLPVSGAVAVAGPGAIAFTIFMGHGTCSTAPSPLLLQKHVPNRGPLLEAGPSLHYGTGEWQQRTEVNKCVPLGTHSMRPKLAPLPGEGSQMLI